jgi:hypothetical protein
MAVWWLIGLTVVVPIVACFLVMIIGIFLESRLERAKIKAGTK